MTNLVADAETMESMGGSFPLIRSVADIGTRFMNLITRWNRDDAVE